MLRGGYIMKRQQNSNKLKVLATPVHHTNILARLQVLMRILLEVLLTLQCVYGGLLQSDESKYMTAWDTITEDSYSTPLPDAVSSNCRGKLITKWFFLYL